jgi:ATP-dependent DNA helicase DinG
MATFVALDIETTGLDPGLDKIIEIGAVKFNPNRIDEEFTTLINPGRKIPAFITQLTGITDQMVIQSPSIQDVLQELVYFIGNLPVLGHNVRFDASFFRKFGALETNDLIDTYELASVLLPTASRYNLGALAQALNIPLPATHRALDDAHAARAVFLSLIKEAENLPVQLLAEFIRLSEDLDWGASLPFKEVLRKKSKEPIQPREIAHSVSPGLLFTKSSNLSPKILEPKEIFTPLDNDEVASYLEQGGKFSHHFPNYEFRPQQVEMLRAVAHALSEGHHLMVEAGTGVGKSMAYLLPAAIWAMQNNTRVVISTNTINLQDQLMNKDIPDLRNALGFDLRSVILKGRSNYLCPRRLEYLRRRGPESIEEMRVLGKVLVWVQASQSGDRAEINLNGPIERSIWDKISADDEGCTTENCIKWTGGNCPFFQIRQAALGAHLIIVNHALLLADVATGNRVLPDYSYLIVDEAHHLEDATTDALSFKISQYDVDWLLRELGSPTSGGLGWLLNATQGILAPSDYATLTQLIQKLTDLAFRFDSEIRGFFSGINTFLVERRDGRPLGTYSQQERILPASRTLPIWGEVELSWDDTLHVLDPIIEILEKIHQGTGEIVDHLREEDNELFGIFSNLYRRFTELRANIDGMVFKPIPEVVYWVEIQPGNSKLSLHTAPIHIGALMDRFLWREKTSIILTSATLTTTGEFDYLRGRLNAEYADELALGSPFDYENAALLYMVSNIPEPNDRSGHQKAVERAIITLATMTGGKTLVLFTSYDQLKRTSQVLSPQLARHDIVVYEQGEGASPHSLLETFRYSERAVLLGTRAFWEGVDIPGEALSVLVIVKLPFDVPSNPIISARAEMFEDPFFQYSLPEAILRFRQGFGRLIRTQSDKGIVVILDSRILTKRYGKQFIDSLPQCTFKVGSLDQLGQVASRWLNL